MPEQSLRNEILNALKEYYGFSNAGEIDWTLIDSILAAIKKRLPAEMEYVEGNYPKGIAGWNSYRKEVLEILEGK